MTLRTSLTFFAVAFVLTIAPVHAFAQIGDWSRISRSWPAG